MTWRSLFQERLDEIAKRFYQHLLSYEETRKVFKDEEMIRRLGEAQKAYLMQAVQGPYDAAYFDRRWRIGFIHNAIHVEPQWFIGAFQLYHRILYPMILERYPDDAQAVVDHILALDKIMNLDMQLGIQSYMIHYSDTMEKLQALNLQIEAASAAKSQFLANMSHEFRTPLNAIIGFTEVLQDQIPGPLNADQLEYLGDIHNAGQLLLRLINDVLDLAKVEAGRLELFYETFPIAQTVRETVTALRGAAEKKGLSIQVNLPPDLGLITADQIRFKQILFNLLSNAVKFTDHGGVVVSGCDRGRSVARGGSRHRHRHAHGGHGPDFCRIQPGGCLPCQAPRRNRAGAGALQATGGGSRRADLAGQQVRRRQHLSCVAAPAAAEFPEDRSAMAAQDQGSEPIWKMRAPALKPGRVLIRATPFWWWKTTRRRQNS